MLKRIGLVLIGASLVWGAAIAQEKAKNICKATHLGPYTVAISCTNGADPTGRKLDDNTLIISCQSSAQTRTASR